MRRMRLVPIGVLALIAIAACEKAPDKGVKARAFCHDVIQYGTSVADCQAKPDQCAKYPASCLGFDADAGTTCLDEFSTLACSELLFIQDGNPVIGLPGSCGAVCK
jgi:hypothetical protein